jgi:hypothetical protein
MDCWPTDERISDLNLGRKAQSPRLGYLHLDAGASQAVTLTERNGRFEWTSIVDTVKG